MSPLDVAERYAAAIDAADDEALRACYAPDARVWHNTDNKDQTVEENIALGQWLRRKVPDVTFTEVTNLATLNGFVRRCVMRGTAANGTVLSIPSCIVALVSANGLIERVEEYLDPTPLAALRN
jgi:ketosteroid isomerase-like protein